MSQPIPMTNAVKRIEQAQVPAERFHMTADVSGALGVDCLDPKEDQKIPRMRLIQPTSRMEGEPGFFHNSISNLAVPEFEAVIIRIQKGRVLWPATYQADQDPLCASDDAMSPREGIGNNYDGGKGCYVCPKQEWGENNKPPDCALAYNYLMVEVASGMPFLLTMSRTSATTAKQLNTMLRAYGCSHKFLFSSQKVENEKGKFFEWRVTDGGEVADWKDYLQMARSMGAEKVTTDTGDDLKGKPVQAQRTPTKMAEMDTMPF